jgi:hypothetical protein
MFSDLIYGIMNLSYVTHYIYIYSSFFHNPVHCWYCKYSCMYFCLWSNLIYCVLNPMWIEYIYIYTIFLQMVNSEAAVNWVLVKVNRCWGLKVVKKKENRGTANRSFCWLPFVKLLGLEMSGASCTWSRRVGVVSVRGWRCSGRQERQNLRGKINILN